jgi:hypothetical protein
MIDTFEELNFSTLETPEQIETYIQENTGASFQEIKTRLSSCLKDKAEELSLEFTNIAPNGNYEALIEDNESMTFFLKEEATKEENWLLNQLEVVKHANQDMLEIVFTNKAVDDGDTLEGYVFLSKSGKIRHAFTQGNGKG